MKFMLMMSCTKAQFATMADWTPAEFKAHVEFMIAFNRDLAARGELLLAEGLDVPANAALVKAVRADAPVVSDGPFAETKEFLAGFWLIRCQDRARAIAIAAKASTAPGPGGKPIGIPIELRQVGEAPEV
ncbi:MAG: YciI family protein [Planctomycetota bacterium]